jgi:NCS2 family nucleobase:cation symporter-2
MARKPQNLLYGVDDRPPLSIVLVLAVQHVIFLSFGLIVATLILRTLGASEEVTRNVLCMAMVASGVATILQALRKGPVGSGYLCTEGVDPTFVSLSITAGGQGGLPLVFGLTMLSGIVESALSRFLDRLRVLFPPEVTGVVLLMVGLNIVPLTALKFFGVSQAVEPIDSKELAVGIVALLVMVGTNIWSKGKLRLYSILLGMAAGYAAAIATGTLTAETLAPVRDLPLFSLPDPSHIAYRFDLALLPMVLIVTVASTLKSIATLTMCERVNDEDWVRPDMANTRKGILADGISTFLSGLLGSVGQSLYASSVGLSAATGTTSRVIAYWVGGFFVALAFLPKIAALFVAMPEPVMGATLLFMVCFMVISGLQIIMSRMIDIRRTFVVAVSLIFGLSVDIYPEIYHRGHPHLEAFFGSSLTVATVLAVALNLVVRIGIRKRIGLQLLPGRDSSQTVMDFLERQGAAWGARKDVVQRAASVLVEMFETLGERGLSKGPISVEAAFDEFNLDLDVKYEGRAMPFPEASPPPAAASGDEESLLAFSGGLIRKLATGVKATAQNGECRVQIHFQH